LFTRSVYSLTKLTAEKVHFTWLMISEHLVSKNHVHYTLGQLFKHVCSFVPLIYRPWIMLESFVMINVNKIIMVKIRKTRQLARYWRDRLGMLLGNGHSRCGKQQLWIAAGRTVCLREEGLPMSNNWLEIWNPVTNLRISSEGNS
jgi:hypothetical protein